MRKYLFMALVATISVSIVPVFVNAETVEKITSVEELIFKDLTFVITASKKEENIQEAPAVVTVITAAEIKDFGANTFYDVLQRIPSIQPVGTHLYPRNTSVVRGDLIGPYDNHILILINGRPFRDDVSGGLNASFYNMFPVEAIDRIEFVHGPGSVLYGTNAFEGVINIITKKPVKDSEAEVTAGAGSFGANIGKVSFGLKKNDLSLFADVNYMKDDGWDYSAISRNPAPGSQRTGSTKYGNNNTSGFLFLQYKNFTFNSYIANLEQKNFGLVPLWQTTGTDGASWLATTRRFADIGYAKQLSANYNVQANVTYNYYEFKSYSLNSLASNEGAYDLLGEVSLGGTIAEKVNFIVGGVLTKLYTLGLTAAKIPEFDQNNYSGYVQLDYKPVEKLKLVTGAQYNKPADIDGVTVPRIGAVYQVSDTIGTKASYGEAFRSPWPVETRTNYPTVLVGNPLLKPEKVKTLDCQVLFNTEKYHTSLTLFKNSYENLIARITHPTIVTTPVTSSYDNLGTMDIQGIEVESKVSLLSNLYVEGSGTYQTEKDGKVLTPYFMMKAGVSYHAGFGLVASIFDNYFGEPKKNTGTVLNPEATAVHIASINLNYTIPAMKSLSFNVFMQNVLDQAYYYPEFSKNWVNTLPLEPGRSIYGTASYKF